MGTRRCSDMTATLITLGLALFAPAIALWLERRFAAVRAVGAVVVCYATGMFAANSGAQLDGAVALQASSVAVALAIPMLLFGVDLLAWLRSARTTVLSFALCLVSVAIWAAIGAHLFAGRVDRPGDVAGMLVGIYSGGTPNMAAIGKALDVPARTFLMVNAADVLLGSAWLLVLLSFGAGFLKRRFPSRAGPAARGGVGWTAPRKDLNSQAGDGEIWWRRSVWRRCALAPARASGRWLVMRRATL